MRNLFFLANLVCNIIAIKLTIRLFELAKEIAKTVVENASGIQPVYKSIKNLRPKIVQDLMKNIRPIMDFLP